MPIICDRWKRLNQYCVYAALTPQTKPILKASPSFSATCIHTYMPLMNVNEEGMKPARLHFVCLAMLPSLHWMILLLLSSLDLRQIYVSTKKQHTDLSPFSLSFL